MTRTRRAAPAAGRPAAERPGILAAVTDCCLRHRLAVLVGWLALSVAGVVGALNLSPLLSSGFTLPGTDSNRVSAILQHTFGERADGDVVLVISGPHALAAVRRAGHEATHLLPTSTLASTERLPGTAAAAFVRTHLSSTQAQARIGALRARLGPGVVVTGDPAVEHDIGPALAHALEAGELYLAVPVALLILLLVFGTASAIVPFLFAAFTVPPALGLAWLLAHVLALSDYLLNMVMMIGLGIAIDYSLLVVNRYRDERRRGLAHDEAVRETMRHAGRTILFSGLVVSLGLALMLLLPVPFLRGFGVGGLLVPLVSLLCALTLLPVGISSIGERLERLALVPAAVAERRHALEQRLWVAHTRWVMRRAKIVAPLVAVTLVLAAVPLLAIEVGPSNTRTLPQDLPSVRGLMQLEAARSPYSSDPTTIVVEEHGGPAAQRATAQAVGVLDRLLHEDPGVARVADAVRVDDGDADDLRIEVSGRDDPASPQAQSFAQRLRRVLIPDAHFPSSALVLAGGGAAYAVDFVSRTLGPFPWLILGVIAVTYLVLVRAFRSLLLPFKAIVLNLLTVAAASGLMIALFQWGWGSGLGLLRVHEIEGWIPVFMFTLLFGLSMDYEVFLVTRMREAWDAHRSNQGAVVDGLAHTGRIVTAAGLIMAATFSGLMLGSIPTMQQLGFGLAVAILLDITLVRGLLLPSTMALAGRWNWYLPRWAARALVIRG